ncbi:MAG: carbamoyltransferase HypF [Bacteroidota bacterium]
MCSWQIRLAGIVQGVGFRPFVYKLAKDRGLRGEVSNGVAGVQIRFSATEEEANVFLDDLLRRKPAIARITQHELLEIEPTFFDTFQIVESEGKEEKNLLFTPDYAICKACVEEMKEGNNRRYQYPFITCTSCGPRYSIISDLPYDRPLTTMAPFEMCAECQAEYSSPLDRRHFSQSNSCPTCGISLQLVGKATNETLPQQGDEIKSFIHQVWVQGQIVAIKGIGGYLLTCDARNEQAIQTLRDRKHRPAKPFALMFPSIDKLSDYDLSEEQRQELCSEVSPIVLVKSLEESRDLPEGIAPGLSEVGVMIPYAPVFRWLLEDWPGPIVATSGNRSHAPIVFQNREETELLSIADYVLHNNRKIVIPQDDSVVRWTRQSRDRIIIRRSRGLAPNYFHSGFHFPLTSNILACGADLKSSFCLLHQGNAYVSQYLGDVSHVDTQRNFELVLQHMKTVLGAKSEQILHDLHPAYISSYLAKELAEQEGIDVHGFQHHKAHFAAVLAENNLLSSPDPVLGVIWDGTGYGEDEQIWGGEFFSWNNRSMKRENHLGYFPSLSGDKMAREPRLCALSICSDEALIRSKFSAQELNILDRLHARSRINCSSMGRLFDAVAAVLGLCDIQTFEGEAAMKLEALASSYVDQFGLPDKSYEVDSKQRQIDVRNWLQQIIEDVRSGVKKGWIAAKFHLSLVFLIQEISKNLNIHQIAFSGGTFQNALLIDLIQLKLGQEFDLFFHRQLSPNDENISFGQLILYLVNTHQL